ncbi:MAG: hypothetical protein HN842_06600, partial [Gammaproteobacteria bacterium]|nr:hypothetical protein [Gammaproteobacteria bacterium]
MFWFADLLEKFFGSFSTTDIVPPPPVTSRFERALEFYLENEGGNVDHKSDPGGKTSRGISAFYNPELGDPSLLSDDEVKAFYKVKYWSSLFERLD